MHHATRSASLLAALLLVAACRDSSAVAYRIPKETDEKPPATAAADPAAPNSPNALPAGHPALPSAGSALAGDMASATVPTADGASLKWTAPAHWRSKPATAMRKATLVVPVAGGAAIELAITAFPGDVGGELANVNRWRGQMSLPPVAEADLEQAITRLERPGLHIVVVDCSSPAGQRMLGAMAPYNGVIWFFKLTGPAALVGREKDAYLAFLGSLQTP